MAVVLLNKLLYDPSYNFGSWFVKIAAPSVCCLAAGSASHMYLLDCFVKCLGTLTLLFVASLVLCLFLERWITIQVKSDRFVFGGTKLRKPLVEFICNVTKRLFQISDEIPNESK